MIKRTKVFIQNIPALIWGPETEKVYIFVHGKMGCKEDAAYFADFAVAKGYQVISFDLPEHGDRQGEDYPIMVWNGVKDLQSVGNYAADRWKEMNLYACSLGAYFSLLAYPGVSIGKSLFQCPLLSMEKLIENMMKWFSVTEEKLEQEKEIATPMGETLYWDYWIYVKDHPVTEWSSETYVLYPSRDNLTERETVDEFVGSHKVNLTVLEGAEHFFTEPQYAEQLEQWLQRNI